MALQVVLDTNVIVAALRSKLGASSRILKEWLDGRFTVHLSLPLALQYEDVLGRHPERLLHPWPAIEEFLRDILVLSKLHDIHFLWRPLLPDEGDAVVLELAIAARADVIVTFNVRDFLGAEQFGLAVVTPVQFLALLGDSP